ncbi:ABC transporter substrate-binding protein [Synechococcus sp. Tobar12-5m-g]|uniref:ABC transporter substrate-binding protein n=1 Tax=unclassified Synechococcus TaxID=2626047 RepID=UPI0020CB772A|nr:MULTISPECIES: ABC transporter substrate-binding protein [unclassified Synechococcus]MCP9771180.1 ABC transporter substrate-binding protein [Synechococcus sp. Tobar12-5m-g]MCP9872120.1 ABC transporter substrate-binding protein [Synechococcus sp. Cruz CV-v-12]
MKRFPLCRRSSRNRLVASAVAAALSAGLLVGCQKPVSQDTPIKIGYSAWPGWFPWKVTEDKKLFEAQGVPVAMQWFDGYLDSINALNAGQLDCNSQTLNDTISSIAGGADLQVVLQNDFSTGNDQIIAAKEITSVAGLKGKKVAAEEGTVDHFLLLKVLKDGGLSAKDITFVPLETGAAAAAFAAGKIDAAGVYAPFTTQALKRPGSKALSTSKDHPGAISDLLVCRTEFVAKNPEKIQKIVDAWFATLKTIKDDPAGTLPILVERSGVSEAEFKAYDAGTTIQTLEENRTNFKPGTTMTHLPYAAEQISAFLVETGLAKTKPELGKLLNSTFVDAAK